MLGKIQPSIKQIIQPAASPACAEMKPRNSTQPAISNGHVQKGKRRLHVDQRR